MTSDTPSNSNPDKDQPQPASLREITPVPGVARVEETVPPSQEDLSLEDAQVATREKLREAGNLVVRYGKEHWPKKVTQSEKEKWEPPRLVGRIGKVLPYMRIIPWMLTGLFVTSFFWDFPQTTIHLFGESISIQGLIRIVSVSGLIGFFTNWLAITMLFQPREKRAIIPQGLIPAQRERVIYRLAEAVSQELINEDIIKQKIHDSGVIGRYRDLAISTLRGVVEDDGFRTELKNLTSSYVQDVFGSEAVRKKLASIAVEKVEEKAGKGVGGMVLKMYRTFNEDEFQRRIDDAIADIPNAVTPLLDNLDSALDTVPERIEQRADDIEETVTRIVLSFVEGLDVRSMIVDNARNYDEAHLERILKTTSNEQLTYIKYLGGILGLFGGLVIWQPLLSLGVFTALVLMLWGIDEAIVRTRRS